MYARFFKRFLDLLASLLLLLLLLPLFILVALLIKLDSRGPVFFIQDRVGKNLKLFKVYKFRTMTDKKRSVQKVIGKAEGVTRIGYYLRRFKIDELPQLINVCKGEMSLVGPRPSIQEQLEEMNVDEKRRYSVRPGMTGLAQVCGNIHISWSERYKYDLEYVENVSFLNDMKIILRTVLIIFLGEEKFINEPLKLRETQ
ncbi:sugar transferase [Halalkalibaculum sp. DA384]|uniref:sugar transferase n=1 Tax=Halalkalibaculum sp. DA384 TaxID=3373606 RepID=UPI0037547F6E